jgi:uncharacterized protein YbbC (DUF1343 family)
MEYPAPSQRCRFGLFLAVLTIACVDGPERESEAASAPADVRPGIEVLLEDSLGLVAGLRVGLITNHTGIDREGRSSIDLLAEHPQLDLVALFTPEHGIRGTEDREDIDDGRDERTGLPIYSLYGSTRKPTAAMLAGIDALLFDVQDIGARYYTYVSTMALGMEAAGESGIPFIVLDRPNPVRGDVTQGNVLDPAFSSAMVGRYPVPMRHGMTPGELARLYVGEFGIDVDLAVVPLGGWQRGQTFDDTGLPWVRPSPNMPSVESALAYPGTCLFEGTPLSVGRGTGRAFQWVGAPWLDGPSLANALNAYGLEDVQFEAVTFTPTDPTDLKFDGQAVHGVRIVAESTDYDAPRAAVAMLIEAARASGDEWFWRVARFDQLAGTDQLRLGIDRGAGIEELMTGWAGQLNAFEQLRESYLIYR